jgi:electron transfer flavoprotein beta subunit
VLAEALGVPFVNGSVEIELNPVAREAVVLKKLERGDREKLVCSLPAVVSVDQGSQRPRYPTLPGVLKAKQVDITLMGRKELGIDALQADGSKGLTWVESYAPPRPKAKKFSAPDSSLSAADRLKLLMSGGVQDRGGDSLEGKPEKIASSFVRFLADESIITKNEAKS